MSLFCTVWATTNTLRLDLDINSLTSFDKIRSSALTEVPDLTDPGTCRLIRDWIEQDLSITSAHIDCLRTVRVSPGSDVLVVVREGNAEAMGLGGDVGKNEKERNKVAGDAMDVEE